MIFGVCCVASLLLSGDTVASLSGQAGAKFRANDFASAIELFTAADGIEPLNSGNRFTLAMAYIALNQRNAARVQLEKLPPSPLQLYWLGRLDAIAGDYPAAIQTYRRALALDPEFWRGYDAIGLAWQAMGDMQEAEAAFRMALRTNTSKSPWPAYNLGVLFVSVRKHREAREMLAEALRLDPAFSRAHYQLGRIHESLGSTREALEEYRRASANADYPEVFYALHRVLRQSGDQSGAQAALEQFRRWNSK